MPTKSRRAVLKRFTRETRIQMALNLDGRGRFSGSCGIPFMDHMLELFARHGDFDLKLTASGDRHIDDHHLVEDLGIVMGQAILKALGDRKGIARYGSIVLPMDEAASYVAIDISGRPHLTYQVPLGKERRVGRFDLPLVEHFFEGVVSHARLTLHIRLCAGRYGHHIIESVFKGFARALSQAVSRDPRRKGLPTTKGIL